MVKVFIRTFDKKAKSMKFPKNIDEEELKIVIGQILNIPTQKLVLFASGRQIRESVALIPNGIIHAIDLRNVER